MMDASMDTVGAYLRRAAVVASVAAASGIPRPAQALPNAVLVRPTGVSDPLASPFPTPPSLRDAVEFWKKIFLLHPSNEVVIHDKDSMRIVWCVLDLPTTQDGKVDERAAAAMVRQQEDDLRQRLERLAHDPTPQDAYDGILLRIAGGPGSAVLQEAWQHLRAQRGVADHFHAGLERAKVWLPKIEAILRHTGVPPELAALPFVESSFNPRARSSAGAAGIWQLMPATARGLGLRVRRGHDQRYNVLEATRAAARMLLQNYRMLGSWPLALTAYNHGPYGVRRAVKAVGSTDLGYLIDHYDKSTWGFASKNFYAEFLAVIDILSSPSSHVALLPGFESTRPNDTVSWRDTTGGATATPTDVTN